MLNLIATKEVLTNKITERYNFSPTILAKQQRLVIQVLFRMQNQRAEPSVVGYEEQEFLILQMNCFRASSIDDAHKI